MRNATNSNHIAPKTTPSPFPPPPNGPKIVVLAPTRELCQQIYEESDKFGKPNGIISPFPPPREGKGREGENQMASFQPAPMEGKIDGHSCASSIEGLMSRMGLMVLKIKAKLMQR